LTITELETDLSPERRFATLTNEEWRVFNLSLVRPITTEAPLLIGGGIAHHATIREYRDLGKPEHLRGGTYFLEDEAASGWRPTALVGLLFRGGESVVFAAGFDWAPRSLTLGILYLLL
jgi:hypothetical protein